MAYARYDAVADFYVTGFDSLTDSVSQALLTMLGPVTGLRVMDVACGHGRITRELARRGAHVAGIDISGELIRRAQEIERGDPVGISYRHADVTAPQAVGGGEDISGSWPTTGTYYDEGRWIAQESRSTLRRQVGASHRMLSTYLGTLRQCKPVHLAVRAIKMNLQV